MREIGTEAIMSAEYTSRMKTTLELHGRREGARARRKTVRFRRSPGILGVRGDGARVLRDTSGRVDTGTGALYDFVSTQ